MAHLTQIIQDALLHAFKFPELVTVLISILPIVEARGAIPIAFGYDIKPFFAFLYAFIGSSLMAPILIAVLLPFVRWLSKTRVFKKVGQTLLDKFDKKSRSILKDESTPATGETAQSANANESAEAAQGASESAEAPPDEEESGGKKS